MTMDKDLFKPWNPCLYPVAEGRMIDLFDFKAKTYVSGHGRGAKWDEMTIEQRNNDSFKSQWCVDYNSLPPERMKSCSRYRAVFARVVSPANARTLTACIMPPGFALGNAVPWVDLANSLVRETSNLLWVAIANSIVTDYYAKSKVSLNITFATLAALPLPWEGYEVGNKIHREIVRLALPLFLINKELKEWCEDIAKSNCIGDEDLISVGSRAEFHSRLAYLDAYIARQYYGLSRSQLEKVIGGIQQDDSHPFKRLERKEISIHGEFLTRRLTLDAWDSLFGGSSS
jgi:hypothetical protein